MHVKDLVASDTNMFGGVWLEFANWWTMLRNALTSASPEWRTVLDRLHEYRKHTIEASDLELIIGKAGPEAHAAYSNELFRIAHARTSGTFKAQVVQATEDKIFHVVKQWLLSGKDRSMLGQMQIRSKIVNPRKAKSMDDYKDAVTE